MNGRLDACMMYLYKIVRMCILFISLCLLRPSARRSQKTCLRSSRMILRGLQEKYHSTANRSAIIGEHWTLYQLIVDVPIEHLNLFKSNPLLDLKSLSLLAKGTLIV